jgi:hypothetical protein
MTAVYSARSIAKQQNSSQGSDELPCQLMQLESTSTFCICELFIAGMRCQPRIRNCYHRNEQALSGRQRATKTASKLPFIACVHRMCPLNSHLRDVRHLSPMQAI